MLTLKPTNLPSKPADDYEVFDESRTAIGRILWAHAAPADCKWAWSLFRARGAQQSTDKGFAATREEAMVAFKSAWARPETKEAAN